MVVSEVARELGYSGLKEMQLRVIVEFVRGRDVFAVLPTGYGKSLCYGCLPGVFDKLTRCDRSAIVCIVTPLIAIIEDQVSSFCSRGLLAGSITANSNEKMKLEVKQGKFQLVFFTPEALLESRMCREMFKRSVYATRLKALVIDEAHTVKKW
eukprot:Em0001g1224a